MSETPKATTPAPQPTLSANGATRTWAEFKKLTELLRQEMCRYDVVPNEANADDIRSTLGMLTAMAKRL